MCKQRLKLQWQHTYSSLVIHSSATALIRFVSHVVKRGDRVALRFVARYVVARLIDSTIARIKPRTTSIRRCLGSCNHTVKSVTNSLTKTLVQCIHGCNAVITLEWNIKISQLCVDVEGKRLQTHYGAMSLTTFRFHFPSNVITPYFIVDLPYPHPVPLSRTWDAGQSPG